MHSRVLHSFAYFQLLAVYYTNIVRLSKVCRQALKTFYEGFKQGFLELTCVVALEKRGLEKTSQSLKGVYTFSIKVLIERHIEPQV